MRHLRPIAVAAVVGLAVLGVLAGASPAAAQYVVNYTARTFTSSAPNGAVGWACKSQGCRFDFGPGTTDYVYSNDGFSIYTPNAWCVGPSCFNYIALGALRLGQTTTLVSCGVSTEGTVLRQLNTGGTNTLARTRFCLCTSDGAASPTYAWQNIVTGTVGNSTTCSP